MYSQNYLQKWQSKLTNKTRVDQQNRLSTFKIHRKAVRHTCVSWAWLTWGSRRGVAFVDSSTDPTAGTPEVVPGAAGGASTVVVDAPGAPVGTKAPVGAASSSGRTVPSLSLDKRSWITGSPLRMWQRMASMDSAILPPYTFSGFLFHRLRMQLNAALMRERLC